MDSDLGATNPVFASSIQAWSGSITGGQSLWYWGQGDVEGGSHALVRGAGCCRLETVPQGKGVSCAAIRKLV
jgi:hypothetical protein